MNKKRQKQLFGGNGKGLMILSFCKNEKFMAEDHQSCPKIGMGKIP